MYRVCKLKKLRHLYFKVPNYKYNAPNGLNNVKKQILPLSVQNIVLEILNSQKMVSTIQKNLIFNLFL